MTRVADLAQPPKWTRCHCRMCGAILSGDAAAWYEAGLRHGRAEVFSNLRIGVVGDESDYEPRPAEDAALP